MDTHNIREIMDRAGIKPGEAAQLFKVCRSTYYAWCDGIAPRMQYMLQRATQICKLVEQATADGKLPVAGCKRGERIPLINRILSSYAR